MGRDTYETASFMGGHKAFDRCSTVESFRLVLKFVFSKYFNLSQPGRTKAPNIFLEVW